MQVDLPFFGQSFAAGSGSQSFVDLCRSLARQDIVFPPPESGAPLDRLKALFIVGRLTASEILNPDELYTKYFGGFYETILMSGGNLAKLGDVTFTYSQFTLDREKSKSAVIFHPLIFVKIEYLHDILLVRRIHIKYDAAGNPSKDDKTLLVQPIYRDIAISEVSRVRNIDMNSENYCHLTFVRGDDRKWNGVVVVETNPAVRNINIIEEQDGKQTYGFTEAFFRKTMDVLRDCGILTY